MESFEVKFKQSADQSADAGEVLLKNFKELVRSTLILSFSRRIFDAS